MTPEAIEAKPKSRIVALDLMRGYLILVIASVHLAYYPSLLGSFDGQGRLWISEAEGFFFISGLLIGIIRRNDIERTGLKTAVAKVLKRGWRLYLAGTILTIFYLLWARALLGVSPAAIKGGADTGSWLAIIFNTIIMKYSYGWSDFLIFYAGFLFVTPLVLWLLKRRLWWVVLLGTLSVWTWRWTGGYPPYNSFLQWQVYFFLGTIIGYHWHELVGRFSRLSKRAQGWWQLIMVVLTALITIGGLLVVFGSQTAGWTGWLNQNHAYNVLLVDGRIGLLRPLLLLISFAGFYTLVRRYEAWIVRYLGWLLLPFGRNSLYVYIIESLLLFTIPFFVRPGGVWINSLLEIGMATIVWLCIRYRVLFRVIPR